MINALIWNSFIVPCVRCLNARGCHYMMNSEYTKTYSHMLCSHKGQIPFSVWWIDHKIVGHWLNVGWLEHSKRWVHTWMVSIANMNHACSHPNFAMYSYISMSYFKGNSWELTYYICKFNIAVNIGWTNIKGCGCSKPDRKHLQTQGRRVVSISQGTVTIGKLSYPIVNFGTLIVTHVTLKKSGSITWLHFETLNAHFHVHYVDIAHSSRYCTLYKDQWLFQVSE